MKKLYALLLALLIPIHVFAGYVQLGGNSPAKAVLTTFTPAPTVSANVTKTGNWYKNADGQMVVTYRLLWTGNNGGAGSVFKLPLPTGYSIDQSRYLGTFDGVQGTSVRFSLTGGYFDQGTNELPLVAFAFNGSTFEFDIPYGPVMLDDRPNASDLLDVTLRVWVTGPGF
jgi:hypothetical protein